MARNQYIDQDNLYSDRMNADGGNEDLQGLMPARAAALPAEVGGAMSGGQGTSLAESLGQPLDGAIAGPVAGVAGLPSVAPAKTTSSGYSQTQEKGMVPIYSQPVYETRGHGNQVLVDQGGKFLGYQKPEATPAEGKIETPKPPEILAKEKELGHELEPIYAMGAVQHGSGTSQPVEYGEPIGYRYDNGKSQYVNFDNSGQQTSIQDRQNLGTLIRDLAPLALTAFGANFLAPYLAGGAGAAVGAGEGAAGIGAASHLTPAALEALAGTAGYGTSAAAEAALAAGAGGAGITSLAAPITEAAAPAAETLGTTGGYGSGAANPSLLSSAGAGEAGITSLAAPITETAAEALGTTASGAGGYGTGSSLLGAEGTTAALGSGVATGAAGTGAGIGAASHLTPAALESLMGTAGYGVNASALEAAAALGIPAAQVGAGASSAFPGVTPHLTPAQLESLAGTPGYGKSAAALAAATAAGIDPNIVGSGADLPFPGVNPTPGIGDLLKKVKDKVLGSSDSSSGSGGMGLGGALGLMALMSMMNKGGGGTPASTATIPELTATRSQLPYDVDKKGVNPNTPYRPGQGGVTYFSPTTYTPTPPKAAGGGLMSLGGMPNLGSYSDGGRLLQGPGDGVSDSIPAIIGHKQPARLANGEFVIPARIVSELGNGSTDAGAKRLYEMMDRVQSVRRKTKNVAANTKAAKYLPA